MSSTAEDSDSSEESGFYADTVAGDPPSLQDVAEVPSHPKPADPADPPARVPGASTATPEVEGKASTGT